jgi:hypothetical protein
MLYGKRRPSSREKLPRRYALRNRRGELLTALLLFGGNPRVVIVNTPWYSHAKRIGGVRPSGGVAAHSQMARTFG